MADREQPPHGGIPPEPNASGEPHDVLAAEQFAMPAPEAAWHAGPVEVPPEPNASDEPHDVLAAEQFAMPAPPPHVAFEQTPATQARRSRGYVLVAAEALLAIGVAVVVRRRRRRT